MKFFTGSKQVKRQFLAIFAVAVVCIAGVSVSAQENEVRVIDEVVAVVNDGVITLSRVNREKQQIIEASIAEGKTREAAIAEVEAKQGELIAGMITEELLLQKGKEIGADGDADASVNQRLLEVMRGQGIKSLEVLYEEMRKNGLEPNTVKENWRRQFIRDIVMRREVDSRLYWGFTSKEMRAFYEKHKEKFQKPEEVTLSEIFLSFAGRDEDAVRAKAKMIVKQLREGGDWAKIAVENSEREDVKTTKGSIGSISVDELKQINEKFIAPIAATKVGEVTEPVEITEGIEIFRVDDRKAASKESVFDENMVRQALLSERAPEERKKFLQSLRADAVIRINDTYRPIVSPILAGENETKKSN